MKILIIGSSVLDHIRSADSFRFQPGGVFYTSAALSNLKNDTDEYFLCTGIEEQVLEIFHPAFEKFSLEYSKRVERIPRVHLTIHAEAERCEKFESINKKIDIPFSELHSFDAILINMISGFDIELGDLQLIRKSFKGLIYFDVHSLARGVGDSLVREFSPIPDFDLWAANIDIIQANENEIKCLSSKTVETEIAEELIASGVKILLVTKGENGADAYYTENGLSHIEHMPAEKTNVKNKVGCGDVFGAYFFKTYLESQDIIKSLKTAVAAGGQTTEIDAIDGIFKIIIENNLK